ncbi:MAG: hypothetical protein GX682_06630 [Clostridiaceae bacterium]|nr:hypothetical protein [Clostridiaceae bacterium]
MAQLNSTDNNSRKSFFDEILKNRQTGNSYGNPDDSRDIGDIFLAMREDRELYGEK